MIVSVLFHLPIAHAVEVSAGPSDAQADAALATKLGAYVACINRHGNWTLGSRTRYLDWVKDAKRGPSGREPVVYGLYPLYDVSDCREGIAKAAQRSPSAPAIEQAATAWVDAFTALNVLVAEANTYYELENYKDDRMKHGKAMHAPLLEAFARFNAANDALYNQVVVEQDALAERSLQRLADDPAHRAEYLDATMNDRAKRVVRLTRTVGTESFNRDGYATAVSDYEKAYLDVETYGKQHASAAQGAFDAIIMMSAMDLLKAAKAVMRRERDGFRFSSGERMFIDDGSGEMVEGHPKHLLEKYNRFIEASNRRH
jgi:hypothetical protein